MKKFRSHKAEAQNDAPDRSSAAKKAVTVLHVDDDPNDTALLQVACAKACVDFDLHNIGDGEQAMEYLSGKGKYHDRVRYRLPGLILLDLKMPRTTGLEILQWIRTQSPLKDLPVIVLSGSELREDIHQAYAEGANSYLVKPPSFQSLVDLVKDIGSRLPLGQMAR